MLARTLLCVIACAAFAVAADAQIIDYSKYPNLGGQWRPPVWEVTARGPRAASLAVDELVPPGTRRRRERYPGSGPAIQ